MVHLHGYDTLGRRRLKEYPWDATDEYFYNLDSKLLSDQGNAQALPTVSQTQFVEDDYVWLGGRPVAVIRGSFDDTWARDAEDFSAPASCPRNGAAASCGAYFIVTDHIGKPVLVLDAQARIAGVADYDPFGQANRVRKAVETTNPYSGPGDTALAEYFQPAESGLVTRIRALISGHNLAAGDEIQLSSNAGDVSVNGEGFRTWTEWLETPEGVAQLHLVATTSNAMHHEGAASIGYEYQKYDENASPFWGPLRFPGQYYDEETDLFENWNRYYDPSINRFYQPEPLLALAPTLTIRLARLDGFLLDPYSYAKNNPMYLVDDDGRTIRQYRRDGEGSKVAWACEQPMRDEFNEDCAKEAEKDEAQCKNQLQSQATCEMPEKPSWGDLKAYDDAMLGAEDACIKGANCVYRGCVASVNRVSETDAFKLEYSKCMREP